MPAGRFCVRETSDIPAEGGYGAKERLILTDILRLYVRYE
jgi:hypothetical protein